MKNLLKNKLGFTLVELMMAAGLAGGVGLIAYSTLKSSQDVGTATLLSSESTYLKSMVISNLSNPAACEATFGGASVAPTSNVIIKDKKGKEILKVAQEFGTENRTLLTVTGIRSAASPNTMNSLTVSVDYEVNATVKKISKKTKYSFNVIVFINRDPATNNTVANCMVDTAQLLNDAVAASCKGGAANYIPPAVPAVAGDLFPNGRCVHDLSISWNVPTVQKFTVTSAATQPCPEGQFLASVTTPSAGATQGITNFECKPVNVAPACAAGSYLKSLSAGVSTCVSFSSLFDTLTAGKGIMVDTAPSSLTGYKIVNLTCGTDEVMDYLKSDGTPNCVPKVIIHTCPFGQYVAYVDNQKNVVCKTVTGRPSCPGGQYVKQVNSDGSLVCGSIVFSGTCGPTQAINAVDSNGNITSCI